MTKAISTVTDDVYIELSEHDTLIHANHVKTNVLAMLHLSPDFFHHYQISRSFIVRTKLPRIHAFLLYRAADDDEVYVYSNDDNPVTFLEFHIHNSRTNKGKMMTVKVLEINAEPHTYEPVHEFKVASSKKLQRIHISLIHTGELCESECDLKHAPRAMLYELQLPCELSKSFILASSIAGVVYIRDSYSRIEDPTMLDFSFGRFSRLLYFIRSPSILQA